MNGKIMKGD